MRKEYELVLKKGGSEMEINATRNGHILIVSLNGELDHHSAEKIRRQIDSQLADCGIKELLLDMKKVTFMDSSGLGVILGRYRMLSDRGGKVSVSNVTPDVDRIFKMSGIYSLIQRKGI